jgi:hypothetical protein
MSDAAGGLARWPGRLLRRHASLVRRVAVLSAGALVFVTLALAAVTLVAEFYATWEWYFRMERAIAFVAPIALVLAGVATVAGFALVVVAPEE